MIKTHYETKDVFTNSKTPAGLYARQKWYNEEFTEAWQRDFDETVANLSSHQMDNGSWEESEIETIRRLFGLHLTVRSSNAIIERALSWLFQKIFNRSFDIKTKFYRKQDFYGLPFSPGCVKHLLTCSYLFLSVCFGHDNDDKVLSLYNDISKEIERKNGHLCSVYCTNNALRAFVVHREFSKSRATSMMVGYLNKNQLPSGRWKGKIPLYMSFNALAHLDSEKALMQCKKALDVIISIQNKDGSWGRVDKEWNTFLVVHALKRLEKKMDLF